MLNNFTPPSCPGQRRKQQGPVSRMASFRTHKDRGPFFGGDDMKNTIIAILVFAAFAWASNDDFNDYELAHGRVQVAQK